MLVGKASNLLAEKKIKVILASLPNILEGLIKNFEILRGVNYYYITTIYIAL